MWYEVETKVRVKDFKKIKKKISKIAVLIKSDEKIDDYFTLEKKGYSKKSFRIRQEKNNYVVNFKKPVKNKYEKSIVVKEEFEFKVDEISNFLFLIKDIGFSEWIRKVKKSQVYEYKKDKNLRIEINFIKPLGYFLEIEYLCGKDKIDHAKKTIYEILELLDLNEKDIDNTGYTKMLYDKKITGKNNFILK